MGRCGWAAALHVEGEVWVSASPRLHVRVVGTACRRGVWLECLALAAAAWVGRQALRDWP
jgi:hypothetical protein